MDGAALDVLALERLLSLAREFSVVLSIAEEADLSSLKAAQGIQTVPVAQCCRVCQGSEIGGGRHATRWSGRCLMRPMSRATQAELRCTKIALVVRPQEPSEQLPRSCLHPR
ncbi:unnamed protein product [Lampetra planeri]